MKFLQKLDAFFVMAVYRIREFLVEWFGLTYNRIEKGLIAIYVVTSIFSEFLQFIHKQETPFFSCFWIAWVIMISRSMQDQQKNPTAVRVAKLTVQPFAFARVTAGLFFCAIVALASWRIHTREYSMVLWDVGSLAFMFSCIAFDIPHTGEPGKKAKLALSKLKEMFGTSWVTQPLPEMH